MDRKAELDAALSKFKALLIEQLDRVTELKKGDDWLDFDKLPEIKIGICYGDGIGPEISRQAQRILEHVLKGHKANKITFKTIDGLTIENRAKHKKAIPDDVLAALKECPIILKGPTTTPQKGDPKWPNIESANVAMRRDLDLFACVRPVKVPEHGIDWIFFRENTEGAYVLGSKGFDVTDELAVDFCVATTPGSDRIIRLAFEYAKTNHKKRVTVITKSNIIKTTDGKFSSIAKKIAADYPGITLDEWYIDIMTAKLLDPARRHEYEVMVLPNLYGDILTDEAGQIQGGVGTAGSANIGKRYAMFEAVHGSAPRMIEEGRGKYADPCSMIKAAAMLLRHIGSVEAAEKVDMALEIALQFEKKIQITGRENGATSQAFTDYIMSWIDRTDLAEKWNAFSKKN